MGKRRILLPMLCATLLGGALPGARARAEAPTPAMVVIKDFRFAPMSLTVRAGFPVVFVNHDEEPHSVVSDAGVFRSGALDTGEKYSFRFDKPGTYHFSCSIHPRMAGTIVVQ